MAQPLSSKHKLLASLGYGLMLLLILISINFWDRSIAEQMHAMNNTASLLNYFSNAPILLELISGLIILSCLFKKCRHRFKHLALQLLATLLIASAVRVCAKFIFGRTWPETWINDIELGSNPSWISHGVEQFSPFASGAAYNSFPSGHTLFTFALASVLLYHLPRLAPLWLACMLAVIIGQLGLNYHYLGDILAGATFGILIAHLVIITSPRFFR
ncbi:phosphatase PAP2 family protein [Shewanella sp. UCD-KL12]|uniref:phosphatase PAP2 family protein n=1 Tax=Shewanella sp. UCD-KL12 TaxID=1917163 RepID=UPI000970C450|nr:phosphatase PAP2 family protein [Shewanella sp. UCD-KL12]